MNLSHIIMVFFCRAPRFLLKQMMHANPDKNLLYNHLQNLKPRIGVDPKPPTATLLPLRPKSCLPKMRQQELVVTPEHQVSAFVGLNCLWKDLFIVFRGGCRQAEGWYGKLWSKDHDHLVFHGKQNRWWSLKVTQLTYTCFKVKGTFIL